MEKKWDENKIKKKGAEGLFEYFITRKFSKYITRLLVKTDITANQVTTISFVLALFASVFFAFGLHNCLVIGAIMLFISHVFDVCDGEVARFRDESTQFGVWYDDSTDLLKFAFTFAGLTYGLYRQTQDVGVIVLGSASIINIALFYYLRELTLRRLTKRPPPEMAVGKKYYLGITVPMVFITIFFALINRIYYLLLIGAILGAVGWVKKFHSGFKLRKWGLAEHKWEDEH